MSLKEIENEISQETLKKKLNKKVFEDVNRKIGEIKYTDVLKQNFNSQIEYDFLKSKDINKIKIVAFSSLQMLKHLVDNFLSNKNENPFLSIFDEFGNYMKKKLKFLKQENREIKKVNKKLKAKLDYSRPIMERLKEFLITVPKTSELQQLLKTNKNNIISYNDLNLNIEFDSQMDFNKDLKESILKMEEILQKRKDTFNTTQELEQTKNILDQKSKENYILIISDILASLKNFLHLHKNCEVTRAENDKETNQNNNHLNLSLEDSFEKIKSSRNSDLKVLKSHNILVAEQKNMYDHLQKNSRSNLINGENKNEKVDLKLEKLKNKYSNKNRLEKITSIEEEEKKIHFEFPKKGEYFKKDTNGNFVPVDNHLDEIDYKNFKKLLSDHDNSFLKIKIEELNIKIDRLSEIKNFVENQENPKNNNILQQLASISEHNSLENKKLKSIPKNDHSKQVKNQKDIANKEINNIDFDFNNEKKRITFENKNKFKMPEMTEKVEKKINEEKQKNENEKNPIKITLKMTNNKEYKNESELVAKSDNFNDMLWLEIFLKQTDEIMKKNREDYDFQIITNLEKINFKEEYLNRLYKVLQILGERDKEERPILKMTKEKIFGKKKLLNKKKNENQSTSEKKNFKDAKTKNNQEKKIKDQIQNNEHLHKNGGGEKKKEIQKEFLEKNKQLHEKIQHLEKIIKTPNLKTKGNISKTEKSPSVEKKINPIIKKTKKMDKKNTTQKTKNNEEFLSEDEEKIHSITYNKKNFFVKDQLNNDNMSEKNNQKFNKISED